MWGTGLRSRARVASGLACLLVSVACAASAGEVTRGAASPDEAALSRRGQQLARQVQGLPAAPTPGQLESTSNSLAELVARAQELAAGADAFFGLVSTGTALSARARATRERLEERAGADEAALESLYRSPDWQRLGYSEAVLGYWTGWAQLGHCRWLAPGRERREAMQQAKETFARSALELRLPRIATASLLGLGIAHQELGELHDARQSLERLDQQLSLRDQPELLGPALYQLASVALEQGDIERAREVSARIPDAGISREQRMSLLGQEAEAWLERADADPVAADRAAEALRQLADAGEESALYAAALAAKHWALLEGRDVGPIGELLSAESAYADSLYTQAAAAYQRVLADPDRVPGLERATARYKHAHALAELGRPAEAALALERLLSHGGGEPVRALAAARFHVLAEELAAADTGADAQARALLAAEILLDASPDASEAGIARYRIARARAAAGRETLSLAELEKIPAGSPAYPSARLERVRLLAARLQRLESSGRPDERRRRARELAADLDVVSALIARGRLEPEPGRDATLAVFRAKAAAWSGEAALAVLGWLERARAQPGLDPEGRRALLRLHLAVLSEERNDDALGEVLEARSGDEIRSEWPIWHEALARLQARPAPPATLLAWYARLAPLAPTAAGGDLALGHARGLLAHGEAKAALPLARRLVERDPLSGDAWLLYATVLDATGPVEEASQAWKKIASDVGEGMPRWLEAQLGAAAAARRAGDLEASCRRVAGIRRVASELTAGKQARLDAIANGCPVARVPSPVAENGTREGAVRPGSPDLPTDPR